MAAIPRSGMAAIPGPSVRWEVPRGAPGPRRATKGGNDAKESPMVVVDTISEQAFEKAALEYL